MRIYRVLAPALVAATLAATPLVAQSASGNFKFTSDGTTKSITFNASGKKDAARGDMSFDGVTVVSTNPDVEGSSETATVSLSMNVALDCLAVSGHRASMSGRVTSSSVGNYVGRRVLLAVADNGEGANANADGFFALGLYDASNATWTPSDAELGFDNGASYSWYATDSERPDDEAQLVGGNRPAAGDCRTISLAAFEFEPLARGDGNIQVRP